MAKLDLSRARDETRILYEGLEKETKRNGEEKKKNFGETGCTEAILRKKKKKKIGGGSARVERYTIYRKQRYRASAVHLERGNRKEKGKKGPSQMEKQRKPPPAALASRACPVRT